MVDNGTHFLRKPGGCAWAGGLWWTQDELLAIGLAVDQAVGPKNKASRGGVDPGDPAAQALLIEKYLKCVLQMIQGRDDHPVGNFFGADFEKEGEAHAASSCFIHIAATPSASFRTRLMTPARSVTLIAPRESSRLKMCEHFSACS